jgi:hypothetical protein
MPQVRRPQNERAADHEWRAVESVRSLLMDVDGSGECAADHPEREFKALRPHDGNPNRGSNGYQRTKKCDRVPPRRDRCRAIRPRHVVHGRGESRNEVVVMERERSDEAQQCHSSPGCQPDHRTNRTTSRRMTAGLGQCSGMNPERYGAGGGSTFGP